MNNFLTELATINERLNELNEIQDELNNRVQVPYYIIKPKEDYQIVFNYFSINSSYFDYDGIEKFKDDWWEYQQIENRKNKEHL